MPIEKTTRRPADVDPVSGVHAAAASHLGIALAHETGRWPEAVAVMAVGLEPFAESMTPKEWTELLDKLAALVSPVLRDSTIFS